MKNKTEYSEKNFGLLVSFICFLVALYPLIKSSNINYIFLAISILFLGISFFYNKILKFPAIAWYKLGIILHTVVSPIILFLVYFLSIIITGCIMKIFNRDPLNRKYNKKLNTYWISHKNSKKIFNLEDQH